MNYEVKLFRQSAVLFKEKIRKLGVIQVELLPIFCHSCSSQCKLVFVPGEYFQRIAVVILSGVYTVAIIALSGLFKNENKIQLRAIIAIV
jgi:hypothetical protein